VAPAGALPLNVWYHAAATYDGAIMKLYLNGVLVGSAAKSGTLATSSAVAVNIGRNPDGAGYTHLKGAIDDVRIYRRALTGAEMATLSGTPTTSNQAPYVKLTSPSADAVFTAPATFSVVAEASDADGTIARVDFYAGSNLIGSDLTSPYAVSWSNVPAGSYALTAVARDSGGATTVSSTVAVSVRSSTMPTRAAFTPSSNHATAVDRYVIDFFTSGVDPTQANPVAAVDVGKPAIVDGQCSADISAAILALPAGTYIATITAIGPGGSAQSSPSAPFVR
jgi:hypothetical protein